ncbi:MAG TPA: killer suppression protein [Nitrospirae bacterium]|nr:killer suppression protein [Nitrospirota bacterium]
MEIYFKTRKLQKICSQEKEMRRALGAKSAAKLGQRLFELQAAESLQEVSYLLPTRCHELTGKEAGQFSVDLEHPYRLLFVPSENPVPRCEDGGIDLSKVKEIEIIAIKDPHKKR